MQRVNVRPVSVTWCGRGPHLARLRCVPGVSINRVLKLTGAVSTTCHSMRSVTALHHPSPSTPHSELELCTVPWVWKLNQIVLNYADVNVVIQSQRLRVCRPLWTCSVWIYPIHAWNSAILLFLCSNTSGTDAITVLLCDEDLELKLSLPQPLHDEMDPWLCVERIKVSVLTLY